MKPTMLLVHNLLAVMALLGTANASTPSRLQTAYPEFIKEVTRDTLVWVNGKQTPLYSATSSASPSLAEQLSQPDYPSNHTIQCNSYIPKDDPGRVRHELFFANMYGNTEHEVKDNLQLIYWMPEYFQHRYPLMVNKINGISTRLQRVSNELEALAKEHPDFIQYLDHPSGAFYWRHIQNSNRRSPHSFGIAIDLNVAHANYWIWDTGIVTNKLNQADNITYQNHIPCEIVSIFENNGFIWGGKWQHHDTMHFEYRPEML